MYDYAIIGAGFAGSVLAERLASDATKKVLLVDKRNHIAGNAYDYYNENGILVHKYGPHIFHTNSPDVYEYLSRYTQWRPYEHRVLSCVNGSLYPFPINLDTVNKLYNKNYTSEELATYFENVAESVETLRTSEDIIVSQIGRDLYEKFFCGYTRKQWDTDPSDLSAAVTSRIPVRTDRDDRYFNDIYQVMPLHGYTRMFENMLNHPNIHVLLNTDYQDLKKLVVYKELIFTGPIDEYFDYCYGKLPYRSLQFKHETLDQEWLQQVAVVNYPNDNLYTRITEYKHLTGQQHPRTSVTYEFPCWDGDPFYPVPRAENQELYKRYAALAKETPGVHFVGRLGTYRYYNMDQVVAQALTLYSKLAAKSSLKEAIIP
ncbi:UDP-galactopyranose mutase [Chitinophaga sp. 212800010-3]|uniref:UDP-galactopyranose mutase n=1 Tax=unclassified Chitinophaga TaxID=2619133 RepID=UPI002DF5C019|nr:UDP-galactopyranose mutase [Chitinophaga sp. 212800010-3]